MPRNQSFEESEERKQRPRHENAEPEAPEENPDPAQASGPIEAESWGKVIEVCPGDSVDGDFNGAPELESLDRTEKWEGVDALDAMEGFDAELDLESSAPEEVLSEIVASRRAVLVERLEDARELGLGSVFEAAIAATAPEAGNSPTVVDDELLRDRIAAIDAALEQLEAKSAAQ